MDGLIPASYEDDPEFLTDSDLSHYLDSPRASWKVVDWGDLLSDCKDWLNTERVLRADDLEGKLVLLDFFTYCCINCMHLLPYLKTLEHRFDTDRLAIIGVHSAKFSNEKALQNVASAIVRYDIEHPVVNDVNFRLWKRFDVRCWPTILIFAPGGKLLLQLEGETRLNDLESLVGQLVQHYSSAGKFGQNNRPLPIRLLKNDQTIDWRHSNERQQLPKLAVQLQFPGKIASSEDGLRLAISDSGHHRVLIVDAETGNLQTTIGGTEGFSDGNFKCAKFRDPQGLCWLDQNVIFVADTGNHAIRKIDLVSMSVTTVGGVGHQGSDLIGGNLGTKQELNSPWDVVVAELEPKKNSLIIAAAGSHQLWILPLSDDTTIGKRKFEKDRLYCWAGSGKEAAKNNSYPNQAAFAQPSGLTVDKDNQHLFVADSESSTVRLVDLKTGAVKHLVGGDKNPENLFSFGDEDGFGYDAKLQHPIGVAFCSKTRLLYVADSYNHKVKAVDPKSVYCKSVSVTLAPGETLQTLNEPAGLTVGNKLYIADTNNHRIVAVDTTTFVGQTLVIVEQDDKAMSQDEADSVKDNVHLLTADGCTVRLVRRKGRNDWSFKLRILPKLASSNLLLSEEAPHSWKISSVGAKLMSLDGKASESHSGTLNSAECFTTLPTFSIKDNDSPRVELNLKLNAYVCDKKDNVCQMRKRMYTFYASLENSTSDLENVISVTWIID